MDDGIPSWLDENFIAAALKGGLDKQPEVSIVSLKVDLSSSVEGFSSDIYKVRVNYRVGDSTQEHSKPLVVKVPDASGLINILLGPISCEKEFRHHRELLPKMMIKVNCAFAPQTFYSTVDKVIIMEDLKMDYHIIARNTQLDLEHCKLVLATLAKYHASSVALYSENKELIEFVGKELFFPEDGPLRQWVELGTKTLGESLQKQGYKEYADVFLSRADNIWDILVKSMKPQLGCLNVLNHGDLWLFNLFFKYNEIKEPVEVKFIDYQASRYTLPVMDLVYLIYGSAQPDVREHRQMELYNHYLVVLNGTLEELGRSERLTMKQLKEYMKLAIPWFIGIISFALSHMWSIDTKDEQSFDGLTTAEDFYSGKANPTILALLRGEVLNARLPVIMRQYLAIIES
uniref:CHK kinase-like domain-containing protein n=1 Tax=Cuerna arida TaxID=1464854 RepID=A0A1B6FYP0_9HEMI